MSLDLKNISSEEMYNLIGKLIEEIKLRKYSFETGKSYIAAIKSFLKSKKTARDFLLAHSNKSISTIRGIYFALKFFYENVLKERLNEEIPLAKNSIKLPEVLSREDTQKMFNATKNIR